MQAEEPAGIQDIAHQAAVGGPVHVEGVQRQVRPVPGSGDPAGQKAAQQGVHEPGRLNVTGRPFRAVLIAESGVFHAHRLQDGLPDISPEGHPGRGGNDLSGG